MHHNEAKEVKSEAALFRILKVLKQSSTEQEIGTLYIEGKYGDFKGRRRMKNRILLV
jgi:hypothetical protein